MFDVGDSVRVREWDDMAGEFIVDLDGDIIAGKMFFLGSMRDVCGAGAIICDVSQMNGENRYTLTFNDALQKRFGAYTYNDGMIEPLTQTSATPFNEAEFVILISEL